MIYRARAREVQAAVSGRQKTQEDVDIHFAFYGPSAWNVFPTPVPSVKLSLILHDTVQMSSKETSLISTQTEFPPLSYHSNLLTPTHCIVIT